MGFLDPKTKADCDREIATMEHTIATKKALLAKMRGNPGYSKNVIAGVKAEIENHKGRVAQLKAMRRTLK